MLLAAAVFPSAFPALAALLAFSGPPPATALAVMAAVPIIPPTGGDDTCPNAHQVSDALQAHLPAQVQPERVAGMRPDALHALLDVPADGTVVHFSLIDARGDVQLRRSIPGPGRARPLADCVALAETLAVIVDRYLSSVPYQASETAPPPPPVATPAPAPPPPEPPRGRAGFVFIGGSWMMASSNNQSSLEGRLGGEVELTRRPLALVARISVGAAQPQNAILPPGGSASLQGFPGRLGLLLEVPAGPGTFEPGVTGGIDLLMATSTDTVIGRTDRSYRVSPVVSAETGYRVTLGRHLFVRPRASIGFAIVTYDVAVGSNGVVFHTPSTFSTFGLDAGLVFR